MLFQTASRLLICALDLFSHCSFADNRSDFQENSTLVFASDLYAPCICDKSAKHLGFFVEFAKTALEPLVFQVE